MLHFVLKFYQGKQLNANAPRRRSRGGQENIAGTISLHYDGTILSDFQYRIEIIYKLLIMNSMLIDS